MSVQQKEFGNQSLQQWPPFRATTRAVPPAVGPLRRALTRWATGVGAGPRVEQAVALATSEAITNAVVHAYRHEPAPGTVCVAADLIGSARMRITVSDEGGGMLPRPDSPGLGLGLPLIVELAESVDIDSTAGSGTCISMEFDLLSER